jgi:L-lactate dehydrogenase complex protein LldG
MSDARDDVLRRIRVALGDAHADAVVEYDLIQRGYIVDGRLDAASRVSLFIDRLHDYGAVVFRSKGSDISSVIRQAMESRGKRSLIVPHSIRTVSLPVDLEFFPDDDLSYEALDRSEGVLTGCAVAIAATGTIVLRHSQADGRRALSLVPDYHLCLVYEDQVVETVAEGIRILAPFQSDPITTISGPSATSDIEMTRVKGVHGPRVLDVILAAR